MTPIDERVMDKIRKVQNLASNAGTEGEAQAAMTALQNLLSRHGLSASDITYDETGETVTRTVIDEVGNRVHWRGWLAQVVAKNFRCTVYWAGYTGRQQLFFLGLETEVFLAKTAYTTAVETLYRLCSRYLQERKAEAERIGWHWTRQDGRTASDSFTAGFITGISAAFNENVTKNALVLLKDARVKEATAELNLRSSRSGGNRDYDGDFGAHRAGAQAGRDHVRDSRSGKLNGNQRQIEGR